ncbi:cytochrome b [Sphingomonas lycopersici]|uniref:Cytochrome b n=2 Tax=Sphingomonas TaxID=13687 RepID=A0AA42CV44_9SPHN|nr:cytochrome b [Sphingomonas lycopersici]MCW6532474.1 cytochrome b [Sphingomonas lycopersici]MCW6536118.1 cytochrome b [Sphingomonas lycopersici]
MNRPMVDARYSGVAVTLHWLIALLVLFNLLVGIGHDAIPALRALMPAHKAAGITVLVLTAARLGWRLGHRAPPLPPEIPAWERSAARTVHGLFYVLLVALPLSGWLMVSGPDHRRPLQWFGAFDIPYLPASGATADLGGAAHGPLGWLMLVLVAVHIAAALRHQFILRDKVLARMIPPLAG